MEVEPSAGLLRTTNGFYWPLCNAMEYFNKSGLKFDQVEEIIKCYLSCRNSNHYLIPTVKRYLRHYRRLASYRCQCWRVQTASHRKQEHDSMPTSPSTSSSSSSSSENISYQCDPRRFCCCSADSAHALDHLQVGDRVSPKTIGRCCTQCGRWICPQCLPKTPTNLELFCDKCK